ncbi:MAG: transcription elongation factor GreB [Pseudomonadota bacterium]|nr:transcription elongation factor GreB [Pseudomonadota bacterium]
MGRWRPPQQAGSPYITPEGYQSLQKELKQLWKKRSEVVKALSEAAAEGDRSENAEYIYRKKELGGIDRRIRYLQKRLPNLNIIKDKPDTKKVFFGAWVKLKTDKNKSIKYRIVGADETNQNDKFISIDSPLAKALLKKSIGDKIELKVDGGINKFLISQIDYGN